MARRTVTQEQIQEHETQEAARFRKRAEIALTALRRYPLAASMDGRFYVRHAAKHRNDPWYMAALIRQANS